MPKHRIIPVRLDPLAASVTSLTSLGSLSLLFWLIGRGLPEYESFKGIHVLWFAAGLILLITFHEAVHALTWMILGRLPLKAFEFGIIWRGLMPYCHCRELLSVRVYRWGALTPLLVTGPCFIALLLAQPALWTAVLAALSLSGCIGDLWLFQKLAPMKHTDLVLDCPDEAGCDVRIEEG